MKDFKKLKNCQSPDRKSNFFNGGRSIPRRDLLLEIYFL